MQVRVLDVGTEGTPDLGVWEFPHCPRDRDLVIGEDGYAYQVQGPAIWFPMAAGGAMAVIKTRNTGATLFESMGG